MSTLPHSLSPRRAHLRGHEVSCGSWRGSVCESEESDHRLDHTVASGEIGRNKPQSFCNVGMAKPAANKEYFEAAVARSNTVGSEVWELLADFGALTSQHLKLDTMRADERKACSTAKVNLEQGITGVRRRWSFFLGTAVHSLCSVSRFRVIRALTVPDLTLPRPMKMPTAMSRRGCSRVSRLSAVPRADRS